MVKPTATNTCQKPFPNANVMAITSNKVGTEKISGFFHYKDFTGLDFYFGAKISLRKGFCSNKGGNNRNSKKMSNNCGIEEYKMFKK
jgi:hypothetical protein